MALPVPSSLSPSKVATFTSCGLAFRYSAIDRLPDPATPWTAKGTVVHLALERLHAEVPPGRRSADVAASLVPAAVADVLGGEEACGLDVGDVGAFTADAEALVRNACRLEDHDRVHAVGIELKLEAALPDGRLLRGVVDRLDLRPDGTLVVVDYKTGRAPRAVDERTRMAGVLLYAYLVRATFGVAPAAVELLHLREPVAISARVGPRELRSLERRAGAIWDAVERACATDGFRPNPSWLCSCCAYRDRCPAAGRAAEVDRALQVAL